MKVRRILLENYRRHRHTEIELPDGVTALLGRNGAGKSTLLEALGFAMFGPAATRTGKELLRHSDAAPTDAVRVELDLELAGSALRIVRELRGKNLTPNASLEQDGIVQVAPGGGSGEAVTRRMESLLGMQREGFFTTVVARQKELSRLADESPADRKRLVLELLGIEQIDRAIGRARKARNERRTQVETFRQLVGDADQLRTTLRTRRDAVTNAEENEKLAKEAWEHAAKDLAAAEEAANAASEARAARAKILGELESAHKNAATAMERVREMATAVEEAEAAEAEADAVAGVANGLGNAKAAVDAARTAQEAKRRHDDAAAAFARQKVAVEEAQKALVPEVPAAPDTAPLRKAADVARTRATEAAHAVHLATARTKELRERHRKLASLGVDAPCPTCEQPVANHLPHVLEGLDGAFKEAAAALDAARLAHKQASDDATKAEDCLAEATRAAETATAAAAARAAHVETLAREKARLAAMTVPDAPQVPDMAPLRAALEEAENASRHVALLRGRAAGLEEARMRHRAAVAASEAAVEAVMAAETAAQAHPERKQWAAADTALLAARETERAAERAVHAAAAAVQLTIKDAEAAAEAVARDKALRERLGEAEDDLRLWTALAGKSQDGLLDRFKHHLIQRAGPAISDEASRLLARFTGGRYNEVLLDDDYRIFVSEDGVAYTLDRFSGGEADLVHLALRLAVSRLLADRSGAELRFLALDEVFGSLDAERRDLVVGALRELNGLYTQVLLVTHLESLRDALDQSILVEERDGDAFVTVHTG